MLKIFLVDYTYLVIDNYILIFTCLNTDIFYIDNLMYKCSQVLYMHA